MGNLLLPSLIIQNWGKEGALAPGGKIGWSLVVTTFGGRVLVLYWGGRVFLTTFGGEFWQLGFGFGKLLVGVVLVELGKCWVQG